MANSIQNNTTRNFSIPHHNLPWLQDQINSLAKRAKKLGVVPPSVQIVNTSRSTDAHGNTTLMCDVTIAGEAPVLPGWSLAAVINVIEGQGIIKPLPGVLLPDAFIHADAQYCDHCRTRRVRNDTFVLQHDDGVTFKQVGRSCLKDFVPGGHTSPEALAWFAHAMDAALNAARDAVTGSHGTANPNYIDMQGFLTRVSAQIRTHGWVSSRDAWEKSMSSTADIVMRSRNLPVLPEDAVTAANAIEWASNLPDNQTESNEYLHNIATLSRLGVLDNRTYRIGASIVSTYQREQARAGYSLLKPVKDRSFVGTVGSTVTVKGVILTSPLHFSGPYGAYYIYKASVDGNEVAWNAKTEDASLSPGKTVTLTGKVKEHKTYQTRNSPEPHPQTTLNYVKVA